MKSYFFCLLILAATPLLAQSFDPPATQNIPGLQLIRSDTLTGQALHEYLRGDADLFFEFGCRELYVAEYAAGQEKLKLEAFVMEDAPSAFGVYKLSISDCLGINNLTDFSCETTYLTVAAYGTLYLRISYPSGTDVARETAGGIVRAAIDGNKQDRMIVPGVFKLPRVNKYLVNLRFFEGPIGLRYEFPQWQPMFQDLDYEMFVEKVPSPDTAAILARITFTSNADLTMFLSAAGLNISDRTTAPSLTSNGLYHSWYFISDDKILFLETKIAVTLFEYLPELQTVKRSSFDWSY